MRRSVVVRCPNHDPHRLSRQQRSGPDPGGRPVLSILRLLFTGTINIAAWYSPMSFFFPAGHYWAAWVTIGALVVPIGAKASIIRLAVSRRAPDRAVPAGPGVGRRGFLATVAGAAGVLTLPTVGQTVRPCAGCRCSRRASRRSGPRATR